MTKNTVFSICGVALIFIAAIAFGDSGIGPFAMATIIFVLLIPIYIIIEKISDKTGINDIKFYNEGEAAEFYKNGVGKDSALLYARSTAAGNQLKKVPAYDVMLEKTADELVYTGATYGGVTTGGFHVNKGRTVIADAKKNGRYHISARGYDGIIIDEVKLMNSQLVLEAKKDAIVSRFLKEDILYLRHNVGMSSDVLEIMRQDGYEKAQNYYTATGRSALTNLTEEECDAVIRWISGENNHI